MGWKPPEDAQEYQDVAQKWSAPSDAIVEKSTFLEDVQAGLSRMAGTAAQGALLPAKALSSLIGTEEAKRKIYDLSESAKQYWEEADPTRGKEQGAGKITSAITQIPAYMTPPGLAAMLAGSATRTGEDIVNEGGSLAGAQGAQALDVIGGGIGAAIPTKLATGAIKNAIAGGASNVAQEGVTNELINLVRKAEGIKRREMDVYDYAAAAVPGMGVGLMTSKGKPKSTPKNTADDFLAQAEADIAKKQQPIATEQQLSFFDEGEQLSQWEIDQNLGKQREQAANELEGAIRDQETPEQPTLFSPENIQRETIARNVSDWTPPDDGFPTDRSYLKQQEIEQAYLEKSKQDQLPIEEAIKEPDQASPIMEKVQDTGVNNLSPIGGVGKKQGGALNFDAFFEEKKVDLSDNESLFKRYLADKGASQEVIDLAWQKAQQSKQIEQQLKEGEAKDKALGGIFGNQYIRSSMNLADIPYENLIPYWKTQETDLAGKSNNAIIRAAQNAGTSLKTALQSGGRMLAFNERNSFIGRGVSQFYKNARDAQIKIDEALLHGDSGLQHMWANMSKNEQQQVILEMRSKVGTENAHEGLNNTQSQFVKRYREVMDNAWKDYNNWRTSQGLKPIKGISNYIVDSFLGEYKALVQTKVDGKLKTIGVISENTMAGALEAAEAVRVKLGNNVQIGDVVHNPSAIVSAAKDSSKSAAWFSKFDRFAEIVSMLESDHPLAKEVQDTLASLAEKRALYRGQFPVHFKKKTGAFGSEGNKFWKSEQENTKEFFEAQAAYVEGLYNYLAFRKSTKTLNEMTSLDVDMPRAKEYLKEYLNAAYGYTFGNEITNRIVNNIAGTTGLSGKSIVGAGSSLVRNLTRSVLGLSMAQATLQGGQLIQSSLAMGASLKENGIKGSWITGELLGSLDLALAAMSARGIEGAYKYVSDVGKYGIDYMRKNHISSPHIIEDAVYGSNIWKDIKQGNLNLGDIPKYMWGKLKGFTDWSISAPESTIRGQLFMSAYHYMVSGGMTKENAARYADNAVSIWLGDFTSMEKAKMFNELGALGRSSGNLQTFTMNIGSQYYGSIKNKDFATLGAILASQATLFGYMGLPGIEITNDIQDWIRTKFNMYNMKTIKEQALENPDTLLQYGAVNAAMAATGFDFDMQVKGSQADMIRTDPMEMVFALHSKASQIGEGIIESGKAIAKGIKGEPLNIRQVMRPIWEVSPHIGKATLEGTVYSGDNVDGKKPYFNPRSDKLDLVFERGKKERAARALGGRTQEERLATEKQFVAKQEQKSLNEIRKNLFDNTVSYMSRAIFEEKDDVKAEKLAEKAVDYYTEYRQAGGTSDNFIDVAAKAYNLTPLERQLLEKANTQGDVIMLLSLVKMMQK